MQEPRLRVPAQGPQALLHVAGLPVQEVQPDCGETARDGRAGECPGTGFSPEHCWIKSLGPAGRGFGREGRQWYWAAAACLRLGLPAPHRRRARRGSAPIPPAGLGGVGFARLRRPWDPWSSPSAKSCRVCSFGGVLQIPRISDSAFIAKLPGSPGSPGDLERHLQRRVAGFTLLEMGPDFSAPALAEWLGSPLWGFRGSLTPPQGESCA